MAVWPATYTAVSDTQQNHYIHIFFREQAVSHAKFSDKSDCEDKKRSTEQKYASSWGVYVALLPIYHYFCPFIAIFVNQRTFFHFVYLNRFKD